jgi:hypothetical protein
MRSGLLGTATGGSRSASRDVKAQDGGLHSSVSGHAVGRRWGAGCGQRTKASGNQITVKRERSLPISRLISLVNEGYPRFRCDCRRQVLPRTARKANRPATCLLPIVSVGSLRTGRRLPI